MSGRKLVVAACAGLLGLALAVPAASRDRAPAPDAAAWSRVPPASSLGPPPPINRHLADSPWPTMHRGPYAQASTPLRGPEPGDEVRVTTAALPRNPLGASGPVWTVLGARYADGSRPVWTATLTGVVKAVARGGDLDVVDDLPFARLSGRPADLVPRLRDGGRWNLVALRDGRVLLLDPPNRRVHAVRDAGTPASAIVPAGSLALPATTPGRPTELTVTYDGHLLYLTDEGCLGVATLDLRRVVAARCDRADGETVSHNQFPVDEAGGIYLVSTDRMRKLRWTGRRLVREWEVPYDSRGRGINGRLGSGTTPTLVGVGPRQDRLVVVVDAHTPNRLVAFWRDAIPAGWRGLPGRDRRIAAVVPLPAATPAANGWSVENSPTASGYDLAVAQYNGFRPGCRTAKGVQRLRWDPATRTMAVVWVNRDVNVNGVLTYSSGSNLLYGSGNDGCTYVYFGLDWDTGAVVLARRLGRSADFADGGNQNTVDDDRSITFGGATAWVRLTPR